MSFVLRLRRNRWQVSWITRGQCTRIILYLRRSFTVQKRRYARDAQVNITIKTVSVHVCTIIITTRNECFRRKSQFTFGEKEDPSSVSLFCVCIWTTIWPYGRFYEFLFTLIVPLMVDAERVAHVNAASYVTKNKSILTRRIPFTKATSILYTRQTGFFFCPFQTTRREVVRGRRGLTLFFKILTQMIVFILPRPANYNGIYRLKTSRTSINQQRTARGSFYIMFRFVTVQ